MGFLMDMDENMLLTLYATICQDSLPRMKTFLLRLRGLLLQHSCKQILLLQKPASWMLILLLVQLLWQLLLLGVHWWRQMLETAELCSVVGVKQLRCQVIINPFAPRRKCV